MAFRRSAEPEITREEVGLILASLMYLRAKIDRIEFLLEDDGGEEEEDT